MGKHSECNPEVGAGLINPSAHAGCKKQHHVLGNSHILSRWSPISYPVFFMGVNTLNQGQDSFVGKKCTNQALVYFSLTEDLMC